MSQTIQTGATSPSWRRSIGAWKPLLIYELLISLLSATILGPLVVAASYQLIGLAGDDGVLGNYDLAYFLLSPIGLLVLIAAASVTLGLLFLEYAGLILLADAAFRGVRLRARDVAARILGAAPRLYVLAILQSALVLLAALPFVAAAGSVYWLLLSGTDINFYLANRPPRFQAAVAIGIVLIIGLAVVAAWLFVRWAFALPAALLDGRPAVAALRASRTLARGRAGRLLGAIIVWLVVRNAMILGAIPLLDRLNEVVLARFDGRLTTMLGSAVAMLFLDAAVLQTLSAVFAIALAVYLTLEYRRVEPVRDETLEEPALPGVDRRARRAVLGLVLVGPAASLTSAVVLAREFVDERPTLVTAHRAGPKSAPENSLAALRLSIEAGADFAEIDVQQTRDGEVVLLHDRDLRRVAGVARDVADLSLAEVRQARLLLDGVATDEPIPTLAEVIAACGDRIRLNVELKDYGRGPDLARASVDVLREHDFAERSIFCSLKLPPLAQAKRADPAIPVGFVLSASRGDLTRLPVNFLSLQHRTINAGVLRRLHRRGFEVHAWTVSDRPTALRLLDLGVDNLITDDPALMRQIVDSYAALDTHERILLRLRRWMRE